MTFLSQSDVSSEAWHVVTTVDALLDSDEEDIDEPARHAYGTLHSTAIRSYLTFVSLFPAMRLQVLADFHQTITADCPSQWQRASAT